MKMLIEAVEMVLNLSRIFVVLDMVHVLRSLVLDQLGNINVGKIGPFVVVTSRPTTCLSDEKYWS